VIAICWKNHSGGCELGIFWLYRIVKGDFQHLMVVIKQLADVEKFIHPIDRRTKCSDQKNEEI
jgi:hypothetical protein